MRLGTRVWSLGKLLLLIAALGATFLLFFGITVRVALRAQEVDVPPLVGRTQAEAASMLTALGLGVRVDQNQQRDDTIPAGRIMRQDPPAGRQARRERTVRLWVSSGPRVVTVPALAGVSERLARIRLAQEGLELANVAEIRSTDHESDAVVAQDPAPKARAPRVSMLINRSEPAATYVMPDLTGTTSESAMASLQASGFRVTILPASAPSPGAPPGAVIRQRPAPGARVSQLDPISLEVSR